MKKIFLDIETTGLNVNSDKIIEICCIEMIDQNLSKNIFHTYLNPNKNVDNKAYKIHGISDKFLKDKPNFKEISLNFLKFIENSEIIVHNSEFDIKFINFELNSIDLKNINFYCKKITDTLKISRSLFPGKRNSLNSLCKRFNINDNRKHHSAYMDVKLLFMVYLNIFKFDRKLNLIKKNHSLKFDNDILSKKNISIKINKFDLYKHNYIMKKINNNFF